MQILLSINTLSERIKSRFLIIGGHAINSHGYSRSTGDLDLAIESKHAEAWKAGLLSIGYKVYFEQPGFVQLRTDRIDAWPIDLMLLSDETFEKMIQESKIAPFRDCKAPVASLAHLISMKLHALRNRPAHREAKDYSDVVELLKIGKIPPSSGEFRQLCEKYDTIWVYDKLKEK